MTDKSIWNQEISVPVHVIQYIDEGVREKLPPGTEFHGISPSGASYWARTAKINATDASGEETPFFIKVHQFEHGKNMVSCEFEAMKVLHSIVPEMVAEPLAWGTYKQEPETYYFICRYRELSDDIPSLSDFPALVAELHKKGVSETGEFGFPFTTFGGKNAMNFPTSRTWEECFSKGLASLFDSEEETQGEDKEMRDLREGVMTKLIPRLLRPLETEGRTLTPRLVHGDLWDGNTSVDVNTGSPMIFDGTPLYAHNEYELAPWRMPRHRMTNAYISEYVKHFSPSDPAEDFHDRGELYGLRFNLLSSSLYPGNLRFRDLSKDTMKTLLEKYPLGYDGYLQEKAMANNKEAVAANAGISLPESAMAANRDAVAANAGISVGHVPAKAEPVAVGAQPVAAGETEAAERLPEQAQAPGVTA